jgi:hypothetical protein
MAFRVRELIRQYQSVHNTDGKLAAPPRLNQVEMNVAARGRRGDTAMRRYRDPASRVTVIVPERRLRFCPNGTTDSARDFTPGTCPCKASSLERAQDAKGLPFATVSPSPCSVPPRRSLVLSLPPGFQNRFHGTPVRAWHGKVVEHSKVLPAETVWKKLRDRTKKNVQTNEIFCYRITHLQERQPVGDFVGQCRR